MSRRTRKTQGKLSDVREVASWRRRGKVAWGASPEKKIDDDRSQYLYENKQKDDNLTEEKSESIA
jgi:hypothetical protein